MGKYDGLRERLGFDFALEAEGALCVLDAEHGVRARVLSIDHPDVERAQYEISMARLESGGGFGAIPRFEESRETAIEVMAVMVAEWQGLGALLGADAPRTRADTADLLRAMPNWRRTIDQFARNPKNYKRPSAAALAELSGNSDSPSAGA
jgi:hypothetical protein